MRSHLIRECMTASGNEAGGKLAMSNLLLQVLKILTALSAYN